MTGAISEVDMAGMPNPLPAEVFVLDVREADEWAAGHIAEAVHIPLMQIPQRLDDIPADQQVLVVCKVGGRSAQATAYLQAQGREAINLAGGMYAWDAAGRAMIADGDAAPYVA